MKCPLYVMLDIDPDGEKCIGPDCAWWEEAVGRCAVREIPTMIAGLAHEVHLINERISGAPPWDPDRQN